VWRPGTGDGGPTWDPEFPIYVRIFDATGRALTMQGQIGRERSCANCHYTPQSADGGVSDLVFQSAGHLHLYGATDTPPPAAACPVNAACNSCDWAPTVMP